MPISVFLPRVLKYKHKSTIFSVFWHDGEVCACSWRLDYNFLFSLYMQELSKIVAKQTEEGKVQIYLTRHCKKFCLILSVVKL